MPKAMEILAELLRMGTGSKAQAAPLPPRQPYVPTPEQVMSSQPQPSPQPPPQPAPQPVQQQVQVPKLGGMVGNAQNILADRGYRMYRAEMISMGKEPIGPEDWLRQQQSQ